MSDKSPIEWTDSTWNPVAGCTVLSAGCTNCYAMRMAARLDAMGMEKYAGTTRKTGKRAVWTGKVTLDYASLKIPYSWKKGRRVFVNSMSDLLHKDVPLGFIKKVFTVMNETPRHQYQLLTKRAERFEKLSPRLMWAPNIWVGVSVENADTLFRIDHLRKTAAKVRFLSLEPLLGDLGEFDLAGIDWVIVGGESGPRARPMDPAWVRRIRDQCIEKRVPFHFKQWGGVVKSKHGRTLDGRTWDEFPVGDGGPLDA